MVTDIIIGVSAFLSGAGGAKLFEYFKNKDNNESKIDLRKLQLKLKEQEDLIKKNEHLTNEIQNLENEMNELRTAFNNVKTAFDMFFNMIIDEIKDKPQLIKGLEMLQENLKKK